MACYLPFGLCSSCCEMEGFMVSLLGGEPWQYTWYTWCVLSFSCYHLFATAVRQASQ
jgi:hypothetical protein